MTGKTEFVKKAAKRLLKKKYKMLDFTIFEGRSPNFLIARPFYALKKLISDMISYIRMHSGRRLTKDRKTAILSAFEKKLGLLENGIEMFHKVFEENAKIFFKVLKSTQDDQISHPKNETKFDFSSPERKLQLVYIFYNLIE